MLNSVCPVLSFLERFQPVTATMCTVPINVLDLKISFVTPPVTATMCTVAVGVLDLKMSFVTPAVIGKRW